MNTTPWNPNAAHCAEEVRFVGADGTDGSGHVACLSELNTDGTCPLARAHHKAWIASGLSQNEWAAQVLASWQADGKIPAKVREDWDWYAKAMEA